MSFSYKPLLKQLIDKEMTKEKLRILIKTSPNTIAKISKNEYISMQILDKICNALDCNVGDVIKHIKD